MLELNVRRWQEREKFEIVSITCRKNDSREERFIFGGNSWVVVFHVTLGVWLVCLWQMRRGRWRRIIPQLQWKWQSRKYEKEERKKRKREKKINFQHFYCRPQAIKSFPSLPSTSISKWIFYSLWCGFVSLFISKTSRKNVQFVYFTFCHCLRLLRDTSFKFQASSFAHPPHCIIFRGVEEFSLKNHLKVLLFTHENCRKIRKCLRTRKDTVMTLLQLDLRVRAPLGLTVNGEERGRLRE